MHLIHTCQVPQYMVLSVYNQFSYQQSQILEVN